MNSQIALHLNNAMFSMGNARRICPDGPEQDRIMALIDKVHELVQDVFYGEDLTGGVKSGNLDIMSASEGSGKPLLTSHDGSGKTVLSDIQKAKFTDEPDDAAHMETDNIIYAAEYTTDGDRVFDSIEPASFIGRANLLVFNTKNRALAIYVEQNVAGLHMEGTTIKNFDPELSYSKTLRKPHEQLSMFIDSDDPRYEMLKIKATAKPLTGRINGHCMLLMVW